MSTTRATAFVSWAQRRTFVDCAKGAQTRPVQGDIGVSFDLSDLYKASNAAEVTYWAFDRMMTDIGALNPDAGLAELADRLGIIGIT